MNEKIIEIANYGLTIVSTNIINSYLSEKKINTSKVLKYFQDNHSVYLDSISKGVWLPILPIDAIEYEIKITNFNDFFDESWSKGVDEENFNVSIDKDFWIADVGVLLNFDINSLGKNEMSYETLDGEKLFKGFKFSLESGNYHVRIEGFKRIEELDYPNANFGFQFTFNKVDNFNETKDPREDDKYFFNIAVI